MMLTCEFCGETGTCDDDTFQMDNQSRGFWCESCDGFTYLSSDAVKHRFSLILESKEKIRLSSSRPNKKFKKRLSPLRYPGGKSKMIDYLYEHLGHLEVDCLVSPFTGGGSFELAMLEAGVVKRLHLNDLDVGIYSLWWTILHAPYELLDKLASYKPTHDDYFKAQHLIKSDFKGATLFEAAWSTLLVNRLAYSGIAKANPLGGKNGTNKSLLARWNPTSLSKRITDISSLADRITITNTDANELIEEAYWNEANAIFIDPPYVEKGRDLYNCYFSKMDHIKLAVLLDALHKGMPGADLIVTYDYNEWLNNLYWTPDKYIVGNRYSI